MNLRTCFPLTEEQKAVMAWFNDTRTGAVMFEGSYRFPEAFRRSPALAERFCESMKLLGPGIEQ